MRLLLALLLLLPLAALAQSAGGEALTSAQARISSAVAGAGVAEQWRARQRGAREEVTAEITVAVYVAEDGSVEDVSVPFARGLDAGLVGAVVEAIRPLSFPELAGTTAEFTYSLQHEPENRRSQLVYSAVFAGIVVLGVNLVLALFD